jgi:hypothetical protein
MSWTRRKNGTLIYQPRLLKPSVKALETAGEGRAEKKAASDKEKSSKIKSEKESEGLGSKIKRFFSKPQN